MLRVTMELDLWGYHLSKKWSIYRGRVRNRHMLLLLHPLGALSPIRNERNALDSFPSRLT